MINISSVNRECRQARMRGYAVTKAGLRGVICRVQKGAPCGVHAVKLSLGDVRRSMTEAMREDLREGICWQMARGRFATPCAAGGRMNFFGSPSAAYLAEVSMPVIDGLRVA